MSESFYYKYKDFLKDKLIDKSHVALQKADADLIAVIKREKIQKPVITVGVTTPAIIAGVNDLLNDIDEYLSERNVDADVIKVGSLGLINLEPIVSVQLPGKTKLFFKNVTSENIISILDGTFNNYIQEENVLAQQRNDIFETWEYTFS